MGWTRYSTARDFMLAASDYFERYEAEARIHHRVALSHAVRDVSSSGSFFATREITEGVCAIAVCTPPWRGLISGIWGELCGELAEAIYNVDPALPAVMGPGHDVTLFADHWCELSGAHPIEGISEIWYMAESIIPPSPVPGSLVTATEADLDLVIRWLRAFWVEAGIHDMQDAPGAAKRAIDQGLFHFWCLDGEPVAMAGHSGPVGTLVSIGPVYTAPEHRRKGYARNLVAQLSLLFVGTRGLRCGLGADRDNMQARLLYERLGYTPVVEMEEVRFVYSQADPGTAM